MLFGMAFPKAAQGQNCTIFKKDLERNAVKKQTAGDTKPFFEQDSELSKDQSPASALCRNNAKTLQNHLCFFKINLNRISNGKIV